MNPAAPAAEPVVATEGRLWGALPRLLALGDPVRLAPLVCGERPGVLRAALFWTCLGMGTYGATLGLWRGPQMALYTAIKLPAVVLLTAVGNGLLNGMLAALTGSGLGFRETQRAVLLSFATLAVIAVSLAPLTAFQALELWAAAATRQQRAQSHQTLLLTHTLFLALGGIAANLALWRLLLHVCATRRAAAVTFLGWLLGNLILGAQVGYALRPFFGSAALPVEFLRPDLLQGNFYEAVWRSAEALARRGTATPLMMAAVLLVALSALGRLALAGLRQDSRAAAPPIDTASPHHPGPS